MKEETVRQLAESIYEFINDSYYQMLSFGVNTDEMRIAFPEYLKPFFKSGLHLLQTTRATPIPPIHDSINGIILHPTWENAITLYCIDYPKTMLSEIPIFKFSFNTEHKEFGLGRAIIMDINNYFKFTR